MVEAIAHRVADLLAQRLPGAVALVDAGELARRFGVSRTWVYDHADMLGAIRLGPGRKSRLRFDPAHVAAILGPGSEPAGAQRDKHRTRATRPDRVGELLPIDTSRGPLGLVSRWLRSSRSGD